MKFTGKNVLVTGGGRGIGAGIATTLAQYGLKVWINYNNSEEHAKSLMNEILDKFPDAEVETIRFNVASEMNFLDAMNHIIQQDGGLDYLVNNAGITNDKISISMSVSEYDQVMNVNARSCFIGSREALKIMARKHFGAVVNISSVTAQMGNVGQVNYASSKGAINSMTKTFALEGALRGVRFNSVSPGLIKTDMVKHVNDDAINVLKSRIPMRRLGTIDEVSYTVAFLLSDYASYITGENININGGIYM